MDTNARSNVHWVVIVGASLIALGLIFFKNNEFYQEFSQLFGAVPPQAQGTFDPYVRVTIDFGDGKKRAFRGEVQPEMTVLVALRRSAAAGDFPVEIDSQGRVVAIDGVAAKGDRRWRIYRDGAVAEELPGRILAAAGDRFTFRYE